MQLLNFKRASWNISIGCNKVSTGCKNCYAERMALNFKRLGVVDYKDGFEFKLMPQRLNEPKKHKHPTLFFINSMSDIFHERMDFTFLDEILKVINATPHHQYQMLTKRPQRMREYFSSRKAPLNLWLGTTIEHQSMKNRIEFIRDLDASVKWICCEPLVGDIGELNLSGINWLVAGAESGANARECKIEWILSLQKQCKAQGVAFSFHNTIRKHKSGIKDYKDTSLSQIQNHEYPAIKTAERSLFD
ncbi:phage Gp37/Gp68 family protein [Campylobacter sp. faydin G-24]|uniref:Phage Gp37/Gp68 family protein n=1 Tax=Campylobacter anatolicus TaxID=2829105 RepID=A0ABS5HJP2_9BACT|nr:DUF5131 family protein [Campylobacter anatolicus]MBR8464383.1 phage Gp37/Gp68 family protein [Campylobacter anatolicus]